MAGPFASAKMDVSYIVKRTPSMCCTLYVSMVIKMLKRRGDKMSTLDAPVLLWNMFILSARFELKRPIFKGAS